MYIRYAVKRQAAEITLAFLYSSVSKLRHSKHNSQCVTNDVQFKRYVGHMLIVLLFSFECNLTVAMRQLWTELNSHTIVDKKTVHFF